MAGTVLSFRTFGQSIAPFGSDLEMRTLFATNRGEKIIGSTYFWKYRAVLLLISAAAILVGCSHDPNVRKQKYLESGNKYFERGQYREAAIEYQNAIQIDKLYADAHYHLALCYLRES